MASLSSTSSVDIPRLDGLGGSNVYGDFTATGDITAENIVGNTSVSSPYISGTALVSNGLTVSGNADVTGTLVYRQPVMSLSASSAQTMTAGTTATTILFPDTDFSSGMTGVVTYNAGTFTSNKDQILLVIFTLTTNTLNTSMWAWIETSQSTRRYGYTLNYDNSSSAHGMCVTAILKLATNDTFACKTNNSSGSNFNTQIGAAGHRPMCEVIQLGVY